MYRAGSNSAFSSDGAGTAPSSGMLSHLDTVYAFALTLVGDDVDRAAALTERVFVAARDDLWSTLGGWSLRERLLAQCAAAFAGSSTPHAHPRVTALPLPPTRSDLMAVLFSLPWRERAAIALVDRLGLSYAEAAAVLEADASEFRELLHRGRAVLLRACRTDASLRPPTTTDRRRVPE